MNITVNCRKDISRPGIVYAQAKDQNGECAISATLDYVISAASDRGYVIINAQDVLQWLHANAEFKAY